MSVGGAVFEGSSKLFDGPLGVVRVGFEGYDLGKTTADTNLTPDQDVKDIIYQQDGTKAADHVRTGIDYVLNVTFGEIKTGLLTQIMAGISTQNTDPNEDSGTIDRSIYQSMRDDEGGVLRVVAVDQDGEALTDIEHILNFYEAIPVVNAELVNWGADTQRNFPVEFRIKWHVFSAGESTTKNGAFGYWGDPTVEDVPAVVYPDVEAPTLLTAEATSATSLTLTFDEDIAYQTAFDATHFVVKVNGSYEATATGGVITNDENVLTFPAATFASGDTIEISISEDSMEDTAATANAYPGIDAFPVTNSVP